jgi:hypothetical protein
MRAALTCCGEGIEREREREMQLEERRLYKTIISTLYKKMSVPVGVKGAKKVVGLNHPDGTM